MSAGLFFGKIDDVAEDPAALEVAQESEAEPPSLRRSFHQPGNIGDDEPVAAGLCDAEARRKRGERVGRHLRPRGG